MDSVECENPTSSSASSPNNQSTSQRSSAWKTPQVSAGCAMPIMGQDSWPALPCSSNIRERSASSSMSRSSSTSPTTSVCNSDQDSKVADEFHTISPSTSVSDLDENDRASDSSQCNKVTIEFPATSSSMLPEPISALDSAPTPMPSPSSLPISDLDQQSNIMDALQPPDSNQYSNVSKVTVEFPGTSSSMLPEPISTLDLASTSSLPFSDLDQQNNVVHQPPAQRPNPSPQYWTHNPNSNPQYRLSYRGNRFQNRGYANRQRYQPSNFNNLNANRGFVPNPSRHPLNRQHGLMYGPRSFPPPRPPPFVPAFPSVPVSDFGVYYYHDSSLQALADVYTALYYAPHIMNGFPMYPYYPQDLMNGAPMYPPLSPPLPSPPLPRPPVAMSMPEEDFKLCNAVIKQIEYYFSQENLEKDRYLKSKMDEQGWVSIHLIAGFRRIKSMTQDINLILEALRPSTVVEVQGDKIRRRSDWFRFLSVARQD